MNKKFILLVLLLGLLKLQGLSAQILKGELYFYQDSLPFTWASIEILDSNHSILSDTYSFNKGVFFLRLPREALYISISSMLHSEVQIVNLNLEFEDTLDIGKLPMIEHPAFFFGDSFSISRRKMIRRQKQYLRTYHKMIKKSSDITIERGSNTVKMITKFAKEDETNRLRLIYIVDFEDLIQ